MNGFQEAITAKLQTDFGDVAEESLRYHLDHGFMKDHFSRIKAELWERGAVAYGFWLSQIQHLPFIIHPDEHIMAAVYGLRGNGRRGALLVTDQRLLFIYREPGFLHCDELPFSTVAKITRRRIGPVTTVTLRTSEGNYTIRTFSQKNASNFTDCISAEHLNK